MDERFGSLVAELVAGRLDSLLVAGDEVRRDDVPTAPVVVPGSFDPVHEGHIGLARAAADAVAAAGLGRREVVFELSVRNVDKPSLDAAQVARRVRPLRRHGPVLVTAAPRFDGKARLLPGAVFAVGHDTAKRLVEPRYYDDEVAERDRALRSMVAAGCRVAVAGRAVDGGRYLDLDDVDVPASARGLFLAVPDFRIDVSSTELRGRRRR